MLGKREITRALSWLIIVQGTGWVLANLKHILSAARTPPAPSIIQFRGGQHWLQLGMHNPQCTARAVLKAAHFHHRVAHIQGPSSYAWRPRIRTSVQGQPTAEAQGHRYSQRPSRTAPVHTAGAPQRRWGGCPGMKPGLGRQREPGVPAAGRGSAHPRTIETNQHPFNYDFPMRAIICSCYHEWIHVSCLRGAPMYYNCNYTFTNVLTLIYPIAKTLNAEINFPRPATVH